MITIEVEHNGRIAERTLEYGKPRSALITSRNRFMSGYKHVRPKLEQDRSNWNWPIALEFGTDKFAPLSWDVLVETKCPLCLGQGDATLVAFVRFPDNPTHVLLRTTLCRDCCKEVFGDE